MDEGSEEDAQARCERNLLEHIKTMQDKAEQQLDVIEEQVACKLLLHPCGYTCFLPSLNKWHDCCLVAVLESEDNGNRQGDHILRDLPRVKKALHQLLADLVKVKRMSMHHR